MVVSGLFSHFSPFNFSPGLQGDIQYLNPSKVFPGFSGELVTSGFPVESGPSGRLVESVTLASEVAEGGWVVPAEVLYWVINVTLLSNPLLCESPRFLSKIRD